MNHDACIEINYLVGGSCRYRRLLGHCERAEFRRYGAAERQRETHPLGRIQ